MTALEWRHRVAEIGERGLTVERHANDQECAAVAEDMGILGCTAIFAQYEIKPAANHRFQMQGKVRAEIEQACVVTLDPVREEIVAEIDLEFWPAAQLQHADEIDIDALEQDDPEPIESGSLPVGRVIYEILASQANPYPRQPGEELERTEAGDSGGPSEASPANPFAKLAALRDDEAD